MRLTLPALSFLAALALAVKRLHRGRPRGSKNGPIRVGMTMQEVSASWGFPASKTRATSDLGSNESWVYADGRSVNFNNGVLMSFSEK